MQIFLNCRPTCPRVYDHTMRTKASCRAFVARRLGTLGRVVTVRVLRYGLCLTRNDATCCNAAFANLSGACPAIVGQPPRGVFSICPLIRALLELLAEHLELKPATLSIARRGAEQCGVAQRSLRPSSSRPLSLAIVAPVVLLLFNGILFIPHFGRSHVALA